MDFNEYQRLALRTYKAELSQTHSTGEREIVFVVPSQMTRKITLHVADKGQGKLFLCDDDLVDIDED